MILAFWSWTGWNALVSIGTLLLAAATGGLAFFTWRAVRESRAAIQLQRDELGLLEQQTKAVRDQADATRHQAQATAAAVVAGARPVLVGVISPPKFTPMSEAGDLEPVVYPGGYGASVAPLAVHYDERDDLLFLSFCVRNIGAGVAFVQRVALLLTRTSYPVRISPPIIAPGETARVLVSLTLEQSDGPTDVTEVTRMGRGFVQATVGLFYTGASPEVELTTELTLSELPEDQGWLITGTKIWEGDTKADTPEPQGPALLASTDNIG